MQKIYVVLTIILGFVLTFQLLITPYWNKKSAKEVAVSILENWKKKDILPTVTYWDNPDRFPAVYSIEGYKIAWERFYRIKNTPYVEIFVRINFDKNDFNQEWILKFKQTPAGWRVVAFYPSHLKEHEYNPGEKYDPDRNRAVLQQIQNRATYKEINPGPSEGTKQPRTPKPKYTSPLDALLEAPPSNETKTNYRTIPAAPSR